MPARESAAPFRVAAKGSSNRVPPHGIVGRFTRMKSVYDPGVDARLSVPAQRFIVGLPTGCPWRHFGCCPTDGEDCSLAVSEKRDLEVTGCALRQIKSNSKHGRSKECPHSNLQSTSRRAWRSDTASIQGTAKRIRRPVFILNLSV